MATILTAYVCLKGICLATTIPTPISLTVEACIHEGWDIAQHATRWRVVYAECEQGRYS